MKEFSWLGSRGRHMHNCERDLWRVLGRHGLQLPLHFYYAPISVRSRTDPEGNVLVRHPCVLPHELFALMFQRKELFPALCPDGLPEVARYWAHLAGEDWMKKHPLPAPDRPVCVPISLWGDDGPFSKNDQLLVLSWTGCLATRSTMRSRFLFTVVPHRWKRAKRTTRELLEILRWSCDCLLNGTYPTHDHNGQPWPDADPRKMVAGRPLANGLRGAVTEIKGDWKWHCEVFGVNSWSMTHICHECPASTRHPFLYTDVRDAPHWRLLPTRHEYLMTQTRFRLCPLSHLQGFHVQMLKKCQMHMMHLGLGLLVNGNAMLELCEEGYFGSVEMPMGHRIYMCYGDFKAWCSQNGVHCTQPPFGAKCLGSLPVELDTRAYNSRCISGYLAEATAASYVAHPTQHSLLRAVVCQSLASVYLQVERCPRFLSQEQADRVYTTGMRCLQAYHRLATEAAEAMRPGRWSARPKLHKIHHMLRDLKRSRRRLFLVGGESASRGDLAPVTPLATREEHLASLCS
jgi:hypothetical protein